jgi:SRSO17 transposase
VSAAYASRAGRALIDRELYLPKTWAADPERRAGAGMPETRRSTTKPEPAVRITTRILAQKAPIAWVAADEVSGCGPS